MTGPRPEREVEDTQIIERCTAFIDQAMTDLRNDDGADDYVLAVGLNLGTLRHIERLIGRRGLIQYLQDAAGKLEEGYVL